MRLRFAVLMVMLSAAAAPAESPLIVIKQATVIAFFTPVGAQADPDSSEALSDFQVYARKVRKPLAERGIVFRELYVPSFRVRNGIRATLFRPRTGVGYYFVAPGKKPRISYGVMTDLDLLDMADEYFGTKAARP